MLRYCVRGVLCRSLWYELVSYYVCLIPETTLLLVNSVPFYKQTVECVGVARSFSEF